MKLYKNCLIAASAALLLFSFASGFAAAKNDTAAETTGETTGETTAETEPLTFETDAEGRRIFTLEDLAYYNGTNGKPVYVAYDGIVYNISNVPQWRGGQHHGHRAGMDFTDIIENAPHGEQILRTFPVVGVLVD